MLMPALARASFRQLLVVAFLRVATWLAAVAVRGLVTLERLLQQSRAGAERSLQLSGQVERLGEHGMTMERAARQYLVLGDAALRQTFERAASEAAEAVQALAGDAVPADLAEAWRAQRVLIAGQLDAGRGIGAPDATLARAFAELGRLHSAMAERVHKVTETRYAALQDELEAGRRALVRQVLGAIALALATALGLALWLARPLQRLEAAIVALGDNRLDERIEIRGPADVRQLGRRLDWLRQRLGETDADKARYLRHVSHELKTPLAALREGVALLQDGVAGPLTDDQREVTRILHDNTATLQQRIEDLLRFNAAAFAAQRLVRRPVELRGLVQGLIDAQQLQWRARGLQWQLQGGPLTAEVDADLLGSALANLLSNAIRFSPRGGTIQVDLSRQADGLQIEVADAGPGIAEVDRSRIFEPFYRGQIQPDSGLPGTGIGLSIVAETVGAHGGRVRLLPHGQDGLGTRFRIELPHALAT